MASAELGYDDFRHLLQHDPELNGGFSNIKPIGWGAQGGVVCATYQGGLRTDKCERGERLALKLVPRLLLRGDDGTRRKELEREVINNTTLLVHPHIATYKVSFVTTYFLVLVLEYVECTCGANGGVLSLKNIMPERAGLEEWLVRKFFQQLVLAVDYSHSRGVAHRDLKPEHCLLFGPFGASDEQKCGILKICDWGFSIGEYSLSAKSTVGTPGYWAPEVLITLWGQSGYDAKAADCFSVGVILYNLLFGRGMFPPATDREGDRNLVGNVEGLFENAIRRAILGGSLRREDLPHRISDGCFQVLKGLLEVNVDRRWSMPDVVRTAWFQQDLPRGALSMNEERLNVHVSNFEEVRKGVRDLIVRAATPFVK